MFGLTTALVLAMTAAASPDAVSSVRIAGSSPIDACPQFFDNLPPAGLESCVASMAAKGWGLSAVAYSGGRYTGAFAPRQTRRDVQNTVDTGAVPQPSHVVAILPGEDGVFTKVMEAGTTAGRQCGVVMIFSGFDRDAAELARRAYAGEVFRQAARGCVPAGHAFVGGEMEEGNRDYALFAAGDPKAFGSLLYGSPADVAAFEKRAAARGFVPLIVRDDYDLWGRAKTVHRVERNVSRAALDASLRTGFARGAMLTSISGVPASGNVTLVWTER
jgi:hypothetical protein